MRLVFLVAANASAFGGVLIDPQLLPLVLQALLLFSLPVLGLFLLHNLWRPFRVLMEEGTV
jgi:hypothetical protein